MTVTPERGNAPNLGQVVSNPTVPQRINHQKFQKYEKTQLHLQSFPDSLSGCGDQDRERDLSVQIEKTSEDVQDDVSRLFE